MSGLGLFEQNVSESQVATTHRITDSAGLSNSTLVCVKDEDNYPQLIEFGLSVVVLPLHVFVLIAMIIHRDVVKRNMVNLYAGNVFVANIVMATWRIVTHADAYNFKNKYEYQVINGTVDHEGADATFIWWTFKKQLSLVLLLVTSGSVGLVINAMRSSMFRTVRTVAGLSHRQSFGPCDKESGKERTMTPSCYKRIRRIVRKHPKLHAASLLLLVWIFPVLLAGAVVRFSSCEMTCRCLFETIPLFKRDNCEVDERCSDVFPPVSRIYIAFSTGLLILYMIGMAVMLHKTFLDFRNVVKQRLAEVATATADHHNELNAMNGSNDSHKRGSTHKQPSEVQEESTPPKDMTGSIETGSEQQSRLKRGGELPATRKTSKKGSRKKSIPGSIFLRSGRTNLRLLFFMYGAYLIGVVPIAIFTLVDGFSGSQHFHEKKKSILIPLIALPILAEFFCTVMLCLHLSGIKSATRLLVVSLVGCVTKGIN